MGKEKGRLIKREEQGEALQSQGRRHSGTGSQRAQGREVGLQAQWGHMTRDSKAITGSVGGPTVCPALGEHFGLIVPLSLHTACVPGPISLLVCSLCCNKVSLTGWLINNRHLLLAVLEAGSPSLAGCQHGHVLLRALFWVADSCLCMVSSHGEESELALWSSYEDTNPIHEGSTLRT